MEKSLYHGYHISLGKEKTACLFKSRARIQTLLPSETLTFSSRVHSPRESLFPNRRLKELEALLEGTVRDLRGPASDTAGSPWGQTIDLCGCVHTCREPGSPAALFPHRPQGIDVFWAVSVVCTPGGMTEMGGT